MTGGGGSHFCSIKSWLLNDLNSMGLWNDFPPVPSLGLVKFRPASHSQPRPLVLNVLISHFQGIKDYYPWDLETVTSNRWSRPPIRLRIVLKYCLNNATLVFVHVPIPHPCQNCTIQAYRSSRTKLNFDQENYCASSRCGCGPCCSLALVILMISMIKRVRETESKFQ